jgi:excinuclease UvrABC helicase subunit UvrB
LNSDSGYRTIDNRPLTFEEFEQRQKQVIYVSATPAKEETGKIKRTGY